MSRCSPVAPLVVLLSAGTALLSAQVPRDGRWTVDDILLAESASDYQFDRDATRLVWVRSQMDTATDRRTSHLWLSDLESGESWALTRGRDTNRMPRWSPDGKHIAFLSSRALPDSSAERSGDQVWLMRVGGGEPWPVTTHAREIVSFAWKGQRSDTLIFAAEEGLSHLARERERAKDQGFVVEDTLTKPPVRLWAVGVESGDVRRISDNGDWIEQLAVSPDGLWAATVHQVSLSFEFDNRVVPEAYLVDLATGARRRILETSRVAPVAIAWAPDGSGLYVAYPYSTHPVYLQATVTRLGFYDISGDRWIPIDLGWARELSEIGFAVVPEGFIAQLADGVRFRPARYVRQRDGWRMTELTGEHAGKMFESWSVSRDGRRVAYTMSGAGSPDQPYVARLDGPVIRDAKHIVELNPSFARKRLPRVEIIRWRGAQGDQVEGVLYYPLDYSEGRRYPLIVSTHGGPAWQDLDVWTQTTSAPLILFNQLGAFVLRANYHGSANYGLEWVESIGGGKYYDLEVPDLEAGVDYLIARGFVHADSVAAQGWSNGAILTTALTVHNPSRYKAASAGAGDVEWISDWGNVDFGAAFDNYYLGASPLEDPELYLRKSPFFQLDRVRTPTIIFFGTEDRNVPPSQGWSHFRALQQLGNTDVRFVLFPGEPHGLRRLAHQRRKVAEEIRWFERHLWGRPDTSALALAPESPLASLIKRTEAARDGGRFGVRVNGVLAPETVRRGRVEVGRFEVTRAQWREFEPEYVIEPGTENYPMAGVTFERARAYAAWLAETSGRAFRLPMEAELSGLAGDAPAGVTLDSWAGYAPNLEDARRLVARAARLGPAALLREVGSAPGDGGEPPAVFDLGGNVAEWVVRADGSGTLVGGSADRPAATTGQPDAGEAYRGLRVAVGR